MRLRRLLAVPAAAVVVAVLASPACAPAPDAARSAAAPLERGPEPPRVAVTDTLPSTLRGTVAFHSDRAGRSKIFVLDLPTRDVRQLTTGDDHHDVEPAWSPDGRRLAFATTGFEHATFDIAVARGDGSEVRRLTAHGAFERLPAWAPGGGSVFFASHQDGTQAVFQAALDGGAATRISRPPDRALQPAAAADGRRLAYTLGTPAGLHVVVHDLVTGAVVRVDRGPEDAAWPAWSPDGRRLAITRLRPGRAYLEILDAATGAAQAIALDGIAELRETAWSPNGDFVAASATAGSGEAADWDLVAIRVTPPLAAYRLTHGHGNDVHPSWAPR